jgi:hypothetical protein
MPAQGIGAESPQDLHKQIRGLGAESPVFCGLGICGANSQTAKTRPKHLPNAGGAPGLARAALIVVW